MEHQYGTVIISNNKAIDLNKIKETLKYKDLIFLFVKRDFISKYKQTILGPMWAVIQPLLTTAVFTFIFGNLANLTTLDIAANNTKIPSFLFYMSGTVCWGYFSSAVSAISNTFIENRNIMGKVYFPRLVIPISTSISGLISLTIQFLMFFLFWIYFKLTGNYDVYFSKFVFLFPLLIFQMVILGMGFGIIISSLTTKYRDLRMLVGFGLQLWQYATPIAYGLSLIPQQYITLYMLNPMSPIITTMRYAFLGTGFFSLSSYLISWIITIFIFVVGIILFNRVERTFMDTV